MNITHMPLTITGALLADVLDFWYSLKVNVKQPVVPLKTVPNSSEHTFTDLFQSAKVGHPYHAV